MSTFLQLAFPMAAECIIISSLLPNAVVTDHRMFIFIDMPYQYQQMVSTKYIRFHAPLPKSPKEAHVIINPQKVTHTYEQTIYG